jgi:hypothetical protein
VYTGIQGCPFLGLSQKIEYFIIKTQYKEKPEEGTSLKKSVMFFVKHSRFIRVEH